ICVSTRSIVLGSVRSNFHVVVPCGYTLPMKVPLAGGGASVLGPVGLITHAALTRSSTSVTAGVVLTRRRQLTVTCAGPRRSSTIAILKLRGPDRGCGMLNGFSEATRSVSSMSPRPGWIRGDCRGRQRTKRIAQVGDGEGLG